MKKILVLLIACTMAVLSACGGGGGGGGGGFIPPADPKPGPKEAILKLYTGGTGTLIGGVDVTIQLPAGITVRNASNPSEPDAGVVVASGNAAANSFTVSSYTAAANNAPGVLHSALVNVNGFSAGECLTITFDVAAGVSVSNADFVITTYMVGAADGSGEINGATVTTSVTVQAKASTRIKLSTSGPASQIGGIDVTLQLPAGVTLRSTVNPPETDAGVVFASGQAAANSLVMTSYAAGPPATVHVVLANANQNGFGIGEFLTVVCDVSNGVTVTAGDFVVLSPQVGDINGNSVAGVTVTAAIAAE